MNHSEERQVEEPIKYWRRVKDGELIESVTRKREQYSPEVQRIIEEEARRRGLWQYVLSQKEPKPITSDGMLEGYICEKCRRTVLNPQTGRCAVCDFPTGEFGYCKKCDRFWSIPSGETCPEHSTRLIPFKAVSTYRRGANYVLDSILLVVICMLIGPFLFAAFNIVDLSRTSWPFHIIVYSLPFLYYFIFEAIWQRTPAKFITGTKVTTYSGEKPSIGKILLRTFLRGIPFEPLSFLGARVRGWHDKWTLSLS